MQERPTGTTEEPTRREAADRFWANYDLPIEYDVAIKGRLSGLTRGSTGTGRARDTVTHLFVEEAFTDGRLQRDEGTYLCSPNERPQFEFVGERHTDENGEAFLPKVSCSTCQDRMSRWEVDPEGESA